MERVWLNDTETVHPGSPSQRDVLIVYGYVSYHVSFGTKQPCVVTVKVLPLDWVSVAVIATAM